MLETSARLLRLLSLFQQRREWAGGELAERLDVDVRTVRRDVDRLRDLGYPVRASSGVGGGYQLGAGSTVPPLLLGDDEAVAVAVALESAAGSIAGLDDTAARVLVKLDQLLPARLRERIRALHSFTVSVPGMASPIDPKLLTTIAGCCRDGEALEFSYLDKKQAASAREVEPHRLAHTGRRWYLVAWDRVREDWRTFRVDRIVPPVVVGERCAPRTPPEDVAAYVARSISVAPYRYRVRLRLGGSARSLSSRIAPWCGVLEAEGDHSSLLSTGSDTLEGLTAQLVHLGVEFELLEPRDLAPELRRILRRVDRGLARKAGPRSRKSLAPLGR